MRRRKTLATQLVSDEGADLRVSCPVSQCAEFLFDLVVQEVSHLFQHGHCIGLLLGVLSELDQFLEELIDIGEVEVAGEGEGAAAPIVLTEERVDAFDGVAAIGAIAEVTEKDFSCEGKLLLEPFGVLEPFRVVLAGVGEPAHDLCEEVLDGLLRRGPGPAEVAVAGRNVELDIGQTYSVLTAVALLLHQEVHLVQAVEGRPVGVDVVLERLLEPEQRDAALVLEKVTHRVPGGSGSAKLGPTIRTQSYPAHFRKGAGA